VTPHSLRLRMILISALAIAVSLTAAGLVLSALFAGHIERAAVRSLTEDLNRLAALVDADAPELVLAQPMSDPRFAVPYGGLYWQVHDPKTREEIRSRSMWTASFDVEALHLPPEQPAEVQITDPEGAPAVGVGRRLSFELADGTVRPLDLIVAEDNTASAAANAAYRLDLFNALGLLAIILVAGAWVQVTLGLAPLKAVRRGVNSIRTGEASELVGPYPAEVLPLVNEVNDLTRAQEQAIQFARERAADLAHGLKAQLQVLNVEAHEIRLAGNPAGAANIEMITADMAETIDHQLGLSRLRRRSPQQSRGTDLGETVDKILRTLRKTSRGAELDLAAEVEPGLQVGLDPQDAAELLGALAENATKWATSGVRVTAKRDGGVTRLLVEDDGPGLTDAQIEQLGVRGVRLDEARSGSGIGISIVREIVAINSGRLAFRRSALGGLCVAVELPTLQSPQ